MLVSPMFDPGVDSKGNQIRTLGLIKLTKGSLEWELYERFCWQSQTKDGVRNVGPGDKIPGLILDARGRWPFCPVIGLLEAPTLKPNGTLLSVEGYDADTGLLMTSAPKVDIASMPTRDDAMEGLGGLEELISETDFVDDPSESVALSLMMSGVLRGAVPKAPVHLLSAPASGSGKSFIVDLANMIAVGKKCPVVVATKDTVERDKRIAGALRSGRAFVPLDNINGVLESDLLCQAVTQETDCDGLHWGWNARCGRWAGRL
jgi:putative DNA primase/helicase